MNGLFRDPEGELPTGERRKVFALTWLSYATYYLARKNFGVVKARLSTDFQLDAVKLGDIDTGYLSTYALGQFLSGWVGDRVGGRRLVGVGMLVSAAACLAFGSGSSAWLFGAAFAVNGLAQATGWPGNVKAMAAWFRPRERGTVMGAWTTNYQLGGLVATALATALLSRVGWRAAFWVPAGIVALVGIAVLLFLPERRVSAADPAPVAAPMRARELVRMPAFWSLGVAYFCLKLIRYSILFWLPFYLRTVLGYSESASGYLSISFEVGGIAGTVLVGLIADRYFQGKGRQVSAAFIAGLAGALLLYTQVAPLGAAVGFASMALVGFCLFGPDALISGATAQNLGGRAGAATAAGAINGIGSLGAILQGRITSTVATTYGWNALYYLFVALALVAAGALAFGGRTGVRE